MLLLSDGSTLSIMMWPVVGGVVVAVWNRYSRTFELLPDGPCGPVTSCQSSTAADDVPLFVTVGAEPYGSADTVPMAMLAAAPGAPGAPGSP
jgi:hypothetical protein